MHLLRVLLPDRPGSLGTIASAMGQAGVDISAMEVVERREGAVIDDFMLRLPTGGLADTLVSVVNEVEGARVLWISRYPDTWGLEGDIEVLDQMLADPGNALGILTQAAPVVFHCQWAALLDSRTGELVVGTNQSPDFTAASAAALGSLRERHTQDLAAGWIPMWGDTAALVCPAPGQRTIVLGRQGGPEFLESEVRRVQHLAALS